MKTAKSLNEISGSVPDHIQHEINLSFDISDAVGILQQIHKYSRITIYPIIIQTHSD